MTPLTRACLNIFSTILGFRVSNTMSTCRNLVEIGLLHSVQFSNTEQIIFMEFEVCIYVILWRQESKSDSSSSQMPPRKFIYLTSISNRHKNKSPFHFHKNTKQPWLSKKPSVLRLEVFISSVVNVVKLGACLQKQMQSSLFIIAVSID